MPTVVDPQPLVLAVKAAVEAAGVAFGDGKKPTVAPGRPWVKADFDAGAVDDRSLRSRDGWYMTIVFHSFGQSTESARIALRAVRSAVLGLHLSTVDGRTVQMPVNLSSYSAWDYDVDPPLYDLVDEWRIRTT